VVSERRRLCEGMVAGERRQWQWWRAAQAGGRRSVRACVAKCGHACVFVLGTRAAWIGFLIYDG
jgi:hypothetical protein